MNIIFRKNNVDLTAPGVVDIWEVDRDCTIPIVLFSPTAKAITGGGTNVSLGTNAPDYNNFIHPYYIDELAAGSCQEAPSGLSGKARLHSGQSLKMNIVKAVVGSFSVDIIGFGCPDILYSAAPIVRSIGDIDLGVSNDIDFVDVDSTNAKIDFSVDVPGRWKVDFYFSISTVGTSSLSIDSNTLFRLSDGLSLNGPSLSAGVFSPPSLAFIPAQDISTAVSAVFSFTTPGPKSIKLQKKNVSSVNVASRHVLANAASQIQAVAYRISE
jgi:hypothetical protein